MAVLIDADRVALWGQYMRDELATIALTKAQLRAAVDAADQWLSDNAAAFNLALPVAARTALTASQKARLLAAVILKRFEKGA